MELKKENTRCELQEVVVGTDNNNALLDEINATPESVALNQKVRFILENAINAACYNPDSL